MKINDQVIRIARNVLSILSAFFIVINGRWEQIGEALLSFSFYLAVSVSFGVTYLLLLFIHYVTLQLDKRLPWDLHYILRPLLQLVFGVFVPLLLAISFAAGYVGAMGQQFATSGYWDRDFPVIFIFVALVNGFYPILYFLTAASANAPTKTEQESIPPQDEYLNVNYNGNNVMLHLGTEVLYFYRDGKLVKVHTVAGTTYAINDTLTNLTDKLADHHFCQINRSTIINTSALKGYSVLKRGNLQARFKTNYHGSILGREDELFKVTKEYIENFKKNVIIEI